jgi:hypothetical protein
MAMQPVTVTITMLILLQVKHYLADYVLQPSWILAGKGNLRKRGGYIHAGIHVLGSLPAYLFAGLSALPIVVLVAVEFVIHYLIDFTKAGLSGRSDAGPSTQSFWALHGADQLAHQLTYAGLIYAAMALAVT